jgi:hypothetical protein
MMRQQSAHISVPDNYEIIGVNEPLLTALNHSDPKSMDRFGLAQK